MAESDPSAASTGSTCSRSAPITGEYRFDSRAWIQFTLQRSVLISPLCTMKRFGWARSHDGVVFVE